MISLFCCYFSVLYLYIALLLIAAVGCHFCTSFVPDSILPGCIRCLLPFFCPTFVNITGLLILSGLISVIGLSSELPEVSIDVVCSVPL